MHCNPAWLGCPPPRYSRSYQRYTVHERALYFDSTSFRIKSFAPKPPHTHTPTEDSLLMRVLLLASFVAVAVGDVKFAVHRIRSFDGTELTANSYEPADAQGPFPLVVMVNSWGLPSFEYVYPAKQMAEKGYIAVEYEARGFFTSQGEIGTAGPNDTRDHSEVISWAMQHWGDVLNASAVAAGGISYGAGVSLMAACEDVRIKAVFAFSGWASLVDALWWNFSPSLFFSSLLVEIGKKTGKESPVITEMVANMMQHKNINATMEWSATRAPLAHIDKLNAFNTAVLMSNQFEDNMLHSNFQLDYWKKLTGPKKLFLAQGTHAEADGTGLFPVDNYIWDACYEWLDRFLKGVQNKVEEMPIVEVSLSDHHNPLIPGKPVYTRSTYSTWPPIKPEEGYKVREFQMAVGSGQFGALSESSVSSGTKKIGFTNETEMGCGIPVANAAERPFYIHSIDVLKINTTKEIVFMTEPFALKTRICGNFNVSGLHAVANGVQFQIMSYLWTVQPKNFFGAQKAALLTHGPMNVYDYTPSSSYKLDPLTFHAACRDIEAGESLMLGMNLFNALYKSASDAPTLEVELNFANATLNIESVSVV